MNGSLKKAIAGIMAIISIMTCSVGTEFLVGAEIYSNGTQNVRQLSVNTDASNTITISGNSNIPNLKKGQTKPVTGTLTSKSSKITSVTVGVYNESGKLITGNSAKPNTTTYNLKNLDKYVTFNTLPVGTYHYIVTATNSANNNVTIVDQTFTVSDGTVNTTDTITISGNSKIPDLKKGKTASVTGTLTSKSSKITSVTVGVYNESGKLVTGNSAKPNTTTYNLKNLDKYVTFNTLPVGTYHYMVKATNSANNNVTVVDQTFTVSDGNVNTTDTITISGNSKIPDLKKGKTASVTGTLTSKSSKITSVTVGVYNESGKLITGNSAKPNATTYNLKNLDRYVTFNTLPVGTYHYMVKATNSANNNVTVVDQTFTVSDGNVNTTDTITISGNSKIPDLKKGKTASVTGTLTSKSSKITSVTVGVYNESGKLITGNSAKPNATTYNLKNLDKYVTFNTLPVGTYHYIVTATNSANNNVTVVDQTFTVSDGTVNTTDTITISGNSKIPDLKKGKTASVTGTLISKSSKITSVTVGVYNESGKLITGNSAKPNATTYNLKNLDKYVTFNTLPVGTYHYIVTATNSANNNVTVVDQTFTVSDGTVNTTDTITISGNSKIPDLKKGKTASVTGTLISKSSKITSVTVGVYNESGKLITGNSAKPNATTYNLKNLDKYVTFNTLPVGTYHYIVTATNSANNNVTVVDQTFTVSDGTVNTTDTITISGNSKIPDLKKGKTASVTGTLISKSSKITSVTVGVYNESGKLITGNSAKPNATTYNLKNLDRYVTFNTLPVGTYHYMVKATNSANNNVTIVDQTFTVSDGNVNTNDTITISGNSKIPDLKKGKTASVTGTLTSKSSKITSVTVGVYNESGKLITGNSAKPNATTYNLKNLDRYVTFNTLPVGTYHYMVKATNSANNNVTIVDQTFTVSDGTVNTTDTITISGNSKIPDLKKGKTASVTGTLTSKSSKITSVTVGVYNESGKSITGNSAKPNATTYNLKNLDRYVTFNTLPVGTYHYMVKATNSANNNVTIVDQTFTVSDGTVNTTDTITISGNSKIPDLKKGKTASVTGTLTSKSSKITSVTVGVYDKSGKILTGKSATPNTTTYNLKNLDRYVTFNTLPVGTYQYIVTASNSANNNITVINQTFTIS